MENYVFVMQDGVLKVAAYQDDGKTPLAFADESKAMKASRRIEENNPGSKLFILRPCN